MKRVMLFGTFDIVHPGHLYLFQQAKKHGDHLTVCVGRDSTVSQIKGQSPFYTEEQRKSFLEHIDLIDQVVLGDKQDPYKIIAQIQPDVITLGYDQEAFVHKLPAKLKEMGLSTQIVRLDAYQPETFSSKQLKKYIEKSI